MDVQASYRCLLGRPLIHEAGAVTSTLHQKLKFVTNGKLVTISGEQALLVSHLSTFSFITADGIEGTQFKGLSLEDESTKKNKSSISSYKEATQIVKNGAAAGWGQVINPVNNETKTGLGFAPVLSKANERDETLRPIKKVFHNGGFLNPIPQEVNVLVDEGNEDNLSGSEEWKTYLNNSKYVSQEESHTPFYPPSDKFEGMFLQNNEEEIPPIPPEVWDTLGEPSGKFDFMVRYTTPESSRIRI